MSNKQAIEIIKKMINEIRCFDPSNDDYLQVEYERWLHDWEYQTLENVLDIIQSLPDTDEWISVWEIMPENIKWNKILCSKWKRVFTAKYYDFMKCWIDLESTIEEVADYDLWQPLPIPPTSSQL